MAEPIILPAGAAIAIIAFLLALLPAGFFLWLWYLRRRDRSVPASVMAAAFVSGLLLIPAAFWLEEGGQKIWAFLSPATVHYFSTDTLALFELQDAILPAIAAFLIVATVEEGLRYIVLRVWFRFSKGIDQIFDGLIVGVGVGVGFATLENTLYFLDLFRGGSFDTLVFVFFLRFAISTLAHVSFSGLMGVWLAKNSLEFLSGRRYALMAFFIPWFLHGLFDWLLTIGMSMYAVLVLLAPLLVLIGWAGQSHMFVVHRRNGKTLAAGEAVSSREVRAVNKLMQTQDSPWNKYAPWLSRTKTYQKMLTLIREEEL
ncbi:MAG: PrsW family intramembrane metalloprotease [Candidatus Andersenbacteria bacterium]|nr:PrsW family intramembrane metalloprotease [Candidatus Andersenbacteria bacterium]MBI3250965.1 PrsW family intramembrane metalloprotease [Candidatus Andersenbacteria bacterium]